MKIEVNIKKKHLFILGGIFLVLALTFMVIAAVPNPGHSVNEIDWSESIPGNIRIAGKLGVEANPESGYPSGWSGGIHAGDIYSETGFGAGSRGSLEAAIYRTGNAFFLGDVGIGTTTPSTKLDVNGDSKLGVNKFFNDHGCRSILNQPLGGTRTGTLSVPGECVENECLLVISTGGIGTNTYEKGLIFAKYKQASYNILGTLVNLWTSEGAGEELDSGIALETEYSIGINGKAVRGAVVQDSKSNLITGLRWGDGHVRLYDDGPGEYNSDSWYYSSRDNGFELIVCK